MSNHEQVCKNGLEFEHSFSVAHAVGDQNDVNKALPITLGFNRSRICWMLRS